MTTAAPSSAHRRAVANPMPAPAAAVTRTVLPSRRWWLEGYSGGSLALMRRMEAQSVRRGVVRHEREHGVVAAHPPEDRLPQAIGIRREHVLGQGRLHQPRVLLELGLELACRPSRVPGVHAGPSDTVAGFLGLFAGDESDGSEH